MTTPTTRPTEVTLTDQIVDMDREIVSICGDGPLEQEWRLMAEAKRDSLVRLREIEEKAARYDWINRQHNFILEIEDTDHNKSYRLRCGEPLDRYIDQKLFDEGMDALLLRGKP